MIKLDDFQSKASVRGVLPDYVVVGIDKWSRVTGGRR